MDDNNSLRIPPLSASQKVVSYSLAVQSQWPCSVRRGYAAAHLARIVVSNPPKGHGCLVSCKCRVLSGTGLRIGSITRPEKSYQL
jgi:hypothetical protein